MKILVFGAAGWTGRAVLSDLQGQGQHSIRAFERNDKTWQSWEDIDGPVPVGVEIVYGDIADFDSVDRAMEGVDAVIHLAVYFPDKNAHQAARDDAPFLVNLKGLWNVLEASRRHQVQRVVHMGSCHVAHPMGIFYSADVRRPDGHLYAVCKRLQEEMCRQFYEAHGLSIVVFRPDYIVDSRLGIGRFRDPLGEDNDQLQAGWVCRHDLAAACRLAIEKQGIDFEILHVVGTANAEKTCNVARTREVLGLEFSGQLDHYR